MPADFISTLSQGGVVVVIFALLRYGRDYIDKLLADFAGRQERWQERSDAKDAAHRAEIRELVDDFRGTIEQQGAAIRSIASEVGEMAVVLKEIREERKG